MDECLGFVVEWFDPNAQINRLYLLKYFTHNNTVEMVEKKSRRLYLKRTKAGPEFAPEGLFVGGVVQLLGRTLTVKEYADVYTRSKKSSEAEKAFALVTPDAYAHLGRILSALEADESGLTLSRMRMVQFSAGAAKDFYSSCWVGEGGDAQHLASNPSVGIELQGLDAVARASEIGAELRGRLSAGGAAEAVRVAGSVEEAARCASFFFGEQQQGAAAGLGATATFDSCTCCVIRPHAVRAGNVGAIVDMVLAQGYEISALRLLRLQEVEAREFLEVYDGVVPTYRESVAELMSGPAVALEVRAEDAVRSFRAMCGPWDVEMARELRPLTIRAKFGEDIVKQGVHFTDLDGDGEAECRYIFETLVA